MGLRTWRRPTYPPRGVTVLQPATCPPRSRAFHFQAPASFGPQEGSARRQPACSASLSLQNHRSPRAGLKRTLS